MAKWAVKYQSTPNGWSIDTVEADEVSYTDYWLKFVNRQGVVQAFPTQNVVQVIRSK